jgi:hypothetical protein
VSDDLIEQFIAQVNAVDVAPQNCGSCRFWFARGDICRRRAPTTDSREWASVWPVTRDDEWCGEWEARA